MATTANQQRDTIVKYIALAHYLQMKLRAEALRRTHLNPIDEKLRRFMGQLEIGEINLTDAKRQLQALSNAMKRQKII